MGHSGNGKRVRYQQWFDAKPEKCEPGIAHTCFRPWLVLSRKIQSVLCRLWWYRGGGGELSLLLNPMSKAFRSVCSDSARTGDPWVMVNVNLHPWQSFGASLLEIVSEFLPTGCVLQGQLGMSVSFTTVLFVEVREWGKKKESQKKCIYLSWSGLKKTQQPIHQKWIWVWITLAFKAMLFSCIDSLWVEMETILEM